MYKRNIRATPKAFKLIIVNTYIYIRLTLFSLKLEMLENGCCKAQRVCADQKIVLHESYL